MRTVRTKIGKSLKLREITICDPSGSINVSLWEHLAAKYNESQIRANDVLVLKKTRVTAFDGRTLTGAVYIELNPKIPESQELREWYQTGDAKSLPAVSDKTLSTFPRQSLFFANMRADNLGKFFSFFQNFFQTFFSKFFFGQVSLFFLFCNFFSFFQTFF